MAGGSGSMGEQEKEEAATCFVLGKILAQLSNHKARCEKMWVQMVILQKNY